MSNAKSLRKGGSIGQAMGMGKDHRDTPINDVNARPHPDHESPENKVTQEKHSAPPKNNLGNRGHSG